MLLPAVLVLNVIVGVFEVRYILAYRKQHPSPLRKSGTEPILAWKFASIRLDSTSGAFDALTGASYGATASYVCTRGPTNRRGLFVGPYHERYTSHTTKLPKHCTCGFYAYRSMKRALEERFSPGRALLRVELYGTVHEGAFAGYRAEKQRVLCAYLFCSACSGPATKWHHGHACCDTCADEYGTISLSELAGRLQTEVLPATKEMVELVNTRWNH